ncbi:MAG TPA: hypothetical protein PLZ55_16680 [bacterium]|nr:hypothetical protein [bacterium]HPO10311.1 hypothetical protein [bacterium]HQO36533.1 hypothetical protein [bacterium]
MVADLLTSVLGLSEAKTPFEHKLLQGDGDVLFEDYLGSIDVAQNLGTELVSRPEANPSTIRSMLSPLRVGKSQMRTLKDNLLSADLRIRKVMGDNINLARILVAIDQLQKAQVEQDEDAIEEAREELGQAKQQAHLDLTKLHADFKASLRYRLQFVRKWKEVVGLQVNLCDMIIACLTEALREKSGLTGNLDRKIQKLIERGGKMTGPDGRTITLRDLLPESPEEIRQMIGVESEEMEELVQQRNELKNTSDEMEAAERSLEDEIQERGVMRMRLPLREERPEEKKAGHRMVFRERQDDREKR